MDQEDKAYIVASTLSILLIVIATACSISGRLNEVKKVLEETTTITKETKSLLEETNKYLIYNPIIESHRSKELDLLCRGR